MASDKQIWKFNKFGGGLNTNSNAKDLKSDEFTSLTEFNNSKSGILKTSGKSLKSLDLHNSILFYQRQDYETSSDLTSDIIGGKGFYRCFSDYTFQPIMPSHMSVQTSLDTEPYDGQKAKMEINPMMETDEEFSSFLWLFDAKPTGGELRFQLKIGNGGTTYGVHKQLDGTSDSYLTCLKATDWNDLKEVTTTDPSGNVNLFNNPYYYNYGRYYDIPVGTMVFPIGSNNYYLQLFTEINGYNHFAGNWWEELSGSYWDPNTDHELLKNNSGNTNLPISNNSLAHGEQGDNLVPAGLWSIESIPGPNWDNIEERNHKFNDNRWIFGHYGETQTKGHYAVGYHMFVGTQAISENDYGDDEFEPVLGSTNDWQDFLLTGEDIEYYGYEAGTYFPAPNDFDNWDIDFSRNTTVSLWMNIIIAINAYAGTDDEQDRFTASWASYDYPKEDGTDDTNSVVHYTSNIQDDVIIEANKVGIWANGRTLQGVFTANSLQGGANLLNSASNAAAISAMVDSGVIIYNHEGTVPMAVTHSHLDIALEDIEYFQVGEVIKIESELMLIKEKTLEEILGVTVCRIHVIRPYSSDHWLRADCGGGAAAQHAEGTAIFKYKIGPKVWPRWNKGGLDDTIFENRFKQCYQFGNAFAWQSDSHFIGGEDSVAQKTLLSFTGIHYSGDELVLKYYKTEDFDEVQTITFQFNDTLETDIISLRNQITSTFDGVTATSEVVSGTPDVYKIYVQANTPGTDEAFVLLSEWTNRVYVDAARLSQGVNEEMSVLLHETNYLAGDEEWMPDANSDDIANNTYGITALQFHSKLVGNWLSQSIHLTKHLLWHYSKTESNNPLMWDEGSAIRFVEANFNLDNKSKILQWFDLSQYFKGDWTTGTEVDTNWIGWPNDEDVDSRNNSGFKISKLDKKWTYTCGIRQETDYGTETEGPNGESSYFNGGLWQATENSFHHATNWDEAPAFKLFFTKSASDNGGLDWQGNCRFYAAAVYDDNKDGLPAHQFSIGTTTNNTNIGNYEMEFGYLSGDSDLTDENLGEINGETLKVFCAGKPCDASGNFAFDDNRIIGLRIYYTHSDEAFETYWLLGMINFRGATAFTKGDETINIDQMEANYNRIVWRSNDEDDLSGDGAGNIDYFALDPTNAVIFYNPSTEKHYAEFIGMPKTETFESINGYSANNQTLSVRYKTQCIGGRRSFVGNIAVKNVNGDFEYYNDRMVVSPVNSLDTYPYPGNILDLDISDGDEIIALKSVGEKLLQFKKNVVYVVNISTGIPSEFFVEAKHKFKGILNSSHIADIKDGVFWINKYGAFIFDGEEIKDLHHEEGDDNPKRIISKTEWKDFISNDSLVGYNPVSRECFVIKNHTYSSALDGSAYIYNLDSKSWLYTETGFYNGTDSKMTNFQNVGDESTLGYIVNKKLGSEPNNTESPY